MTRAIPTLALTLLCFSLTGCWGSDTPSPDKVAEIPTTPKPTLDAPPEQLIANAKRYYYQAMYSLAQENFEALRDGYSPGPYTEYAKIKIGDCLFETREFDKAATEYDGFLKDHPGSKATPYVLLRAGRAHELSNKGIGRDIVPIEKARELYQKLLDNYPDSEYSTAAREYLAGVIDKTAQYEKMVSKFYRKRDNEDAYNRRVANYDEKLKPLIQEANKKRPEILTASAIPEGEAPSPDKHAPKVLTTKAVSATPFTSDGAGATVDAAQTSDEHKNSANSEPNNATDESQGKARALKIQSVECDQSEGVKVFVYLNRALEDQNFIQHYSTLTPQDGKIDVKFPDATAKQFTTSCFGSSDLSVDAAGTLSIRTERVLDLMTLDNPPRVLISAR